MIDYLGNMFSGLGSLFSSPQVPVTRPEVLEQMRKQMQQAPAVQKPGMFFGVGPKFSGTSTAPSAIDPTVINSIYKENVKDLPGVYTGKGEITPEPGMFDALSNMSGEETMDLISGLSGLLSDTTPEQPTLRALPMPGASGGLRLPEVDLMQYYKGLL